MSRQPTTPAAEPEMAGERERGIDWHRMTSLVDLDDVFARRTAERDYQCRSPTVLCRG